MKIKRRSRLPREVFGSHATTDRQSASRIADVLANNNVPVWYSRTNLRGAQQWHDEIGAALKRCDWFVVLLSKSATESKWVKRELLFALRSARYENRILPVKIASCDPANLSWTLEDFQMVDFTGGFTKGCRSLLRTWGVGLNPKY
jgi:hypothetical protein